MGRRVAGGCRQLTGRLSAGLLETFKRCHSGFQWSEELNPRRTLTMPCEGTANDGHDNDNADLILHVHDVLVSQHGNRCEHGWVGFRIGRYVVRVRVRSREGNRVASRERGVLISAHLRS